MVRLLADENFPRPTVEELRRLGHDVVTLAETGQANQKVDDASVLALVIKLKRAVVTLNRTDFMHLHKAQPEHEGIIVSTYDPDFVALGMRIHTKLLETPNLKGQLIRIYRPDK